MTVGHMLREELRKSGVERGSTLLVHASLRRVGFGPDDVLKALTDVLGPEGTLIVPTFTPGNSFTSLAYLTATHGMTDRERAAYHGQMAAFDPGTTPSEDMGVLAEAVRLSAGAVRSAHPQTSFAAVGAQAAELLEGHDERCHLGAESPLGRLYGTKAEVLLLGVDYEACSAFHLAEYRVEDPGPWREYRCWVLRNGKREPFSYEDIELDDSDFGVLGADFEALDALRAEPVVHRGRLGGAATRLFPLSTAVDFATEWLAENRCHRVPTDQSQKAAAFLH